MQGKRIRESSVDMVRIMSPQDANAAGNVHGGVIMRLIDEAGGIVSTRHARTNTVTASVDRIDFLHPVYVGDIITVRASLSFVGRTSMEVGVLVDTENPMTGEILPTASAFLTFVSLDRNGKPRDVPPLILETEEERRLNQEARARRDARLSSRKQNRPAPG